MNFSKRLEQPISIHEFKKRLDETGQSYCGFDFDFSINHDDDPVKRSFTIDIPTNPQHTDIDFAKLLIENVQSILQDAEPVNIRDSMGVGEDLQLDTVITIQFKTFSLKGI